MIRAIATCALALRPVRFGRSIRPATPHASSVREIVEYGAAGNLDKIGVSMDFLERRAGSSGNREIILSSDLSRASSFRDR